MNNTQINENTKQATNKQTNEQKNKHTCQP